MYKAVVFDMDGVILDSERLAHEAWRELAEEYGFRNIDDVYYRAMGSGLDQIIELFRTEYGFDDYAGFEKQAYELAKKRSPGGILPLRKGARELLDYLKDKGVPLALASASEEAVVRRLLSDTQVLDRFSGIVAGDMVTRCKPDPEIFLRACEILGVDPSDACGVEDSANGILALHSAGMRAVMAEDQYHPTPEIAALCEAVFPTLQEVQIYFQNHLTD